MSARKAVALALLSFSSLLYGQKLARIDFRNQPIPDILASFGKLMGKSVLPDESVQGAAGFFMADLSAEEAFEAFLKANALYALPDGSTIGVSRIRIGKTAEGGYDIDSEGADLDFFMRKLSRESGVALLYQSLPRAPVLLHLRNASPAACVALLMKRYDEYEVEAGEGSVTILKRDRPGAKAGLELAYDPAEGKIRLSIEERRLFEVLESMFSAAKREYSLLAKNDAMIGRLELSGKDFDLALRLVLDQAGCSFEKADGLYVVYQDGRADPTARLRSTVFVPLKKLSVSSLQGLLPQGLANSGVLRFDKSSNSAILTGTDEETKAARDFISAIDGKASGCPLRRIDFKFLKPKDAASMLPARFSGISMYPVPGADSAIVECPEELFEDLADYLRTADVAGEPAALRLKYLKPEEALKRLPAPLSKDDVFDVGDGATLVFSGSEERRKLLERYLAVADRPKPQIKYELLIIQYERSDKLEWARGLEAKKAERGGRTGFLGSFASLLSLRFDVISAFGYLFAAKLDYKLSRNEAKVFADTTLNGLSGQEIKFQNTSTFRYRELDSSTGKVVANGVTREISSGLIVTMNGWVSGDGMITMAVSATVSKRGADLSGSSGNPPPTSEKVVNTTVRAKSGEPVVITGLIENSESKSPTGIPALAGIPVIGELFNDKDESREGTEMAIYVVPRLDRGGEADSGALMERIYRAIAAKGE